MLTPDQQISIISNIAGGFSGAFFALIFLGVSSLIGNIVKRKKINYNSLIYLETELNEMIGIVKDDLYLIPPFKKAIVRGNVYWSPIKVIPINKNHLYELSDIDLINDLFEFNYNIRKLNDDIENLMLGYQDLKSAYIQKYITTAHYIQNAAYISQEIDLVEIFLEKLDEEIVKLLVKVRIQIRNDKPLIVKLQERFTTTTSSKLTIKEFNQEKKKLEYELEESSKKSREEINKMIKKKQR